MSRWHNYYLDGYVHFCTATVNGWGRCLGDSEAKTLYKEWKQARERFGVRVLAYVVMPDHIHLLLWSEKGDAVRSFMQKTLSHSSKMLSDGGRFWKERLRVICIKNECDLLVKLDYIHNNPIEKGLADNAEDWPYSSYKQSILGQSEECFECDPWPDGLLIR